MFFATLQVYEAQLEKDPHAKGWYWVLPEGVYLAGLQVSGLPARAVLSVCFILSIENCPLHGSKQMK